MDGENPWVREQAEALCAVPGLRPKTQLWTYDFPEDSVAIYAHAALSGLSQGTSGTSVTPWLDTTQSLPGDAQVPRSHYSCPV